LRQIHRKNVLGPSLGQVWISRSKVKGQGHWGHKTENCWVMLQQMGPISQKLQNGFAQIHREDVFGPSFGWVWMPGSKVKSQGHQEQKTCCAHPSPPAATEWNALAANNVKHKLVTDKQTDRQTMTITYPPWQSVITANFLNRHQIQGGINDTVNSSESGVHQLLCCCNTASYPHRSSLSQLECVTY